MARRHVNVNEAMINRILNIRNEDDIVEIVKEANDQKVVKKKAPVKKKVSKEITRDNAPSLFTEVKKSKKKKGG